jgi:hypothetical protein
MNASSVKVVNLASEKYKGRSAKDSRGFYRIPGFRALPLGKTLVMSIAELTLFLFPTILSIKAQTPKM